MASRYFVAGSAGNNNWGQSGAGSNWSLTDGGAGGQSVPTSSDDVFLTANSPNCTVDTTARAALSLNTTGYTNTITFNVDLQVSGSITLSATTIIAGNSWLRSILAGTHTSNGCVIPNFWLSGSVTHVLADNFTIVNFRFGQTTSGTILNGNQVSVTGNFDRSQVTSAGQSGTTVITMTGTGSLLIPSGNGVLSNNLIINTAGTITFPTGDFRMNGTFTYTAGTISNSSNTNIIIGNVTVTWTISASIPFGDFSWAPTAKVLTLIGDLYCRDFILAGNNSTDSTFDCTGYNIYCRDFSVTTATSASYTLNGNICYISRNITLTVQSTGSLIGTLTLYMNGISGTLSTNALTTGRINIPLTIDSRGTITISSSVSTCNINIMKFTHLSGTISNSIPWGYYPGFVTVF